MQTQKKAKPILALCAILLLFVIIGVSIYKYYVNQKGSVVVSLQLPDAQKVSATINNKPFAISSLKTTQILHDGRYKLVIKKVGYQNFSTNFDVKTNQQTVIIAEPKHGNTPSLDNLMAVQPASVAADWKPTNVTYFYQKTWALVNAKLSDGVGAFFVLSYNDTKKTWVVVVGPETELPNSILKSLPTGVANYLQDNNYVGESNG